MVVEQARQVLRRVRQALWFRRFLLVCAGAASAAVVLTWSTGRLAISLPAWSYAFFALATLLPLAWPMALDKRLFWAGRRLGVGGRLAGLSAALRRQKSSFLAPILADLRLPLPRLFFPEILSLFLPLLLAGLFLLPQAPTRPLPVTFVPEESTIEPEEGETAVALDKAEEAPVSPGIPVLPPGFSGSPPYPLLFSTLFGEEVGLEEAVARLAQEEGLLRQLAELLAEAQRTGLTPEVATEIGEIVERLSRPDVREALSQNLTEETEDLASAQAVVEAAREGIARMREESQGEGGGQGLAMQGGEAGRGGDQMNRDLWGEVMPDDVQQVPVREELAEAQEGTGHGVGQEEGQPVRSGVPLEPGGESQVVSAEVRPGEGPVRMSTSFGLPGESPSAAVLAPAELSPQEAELFVREAALPPELREVVQRYFVLLSEREK